MNAQTKPPTYRREDAPTDECVKAAIPAGRVGFHKQRERHVVKFGAYRFDVVKESATLKL